MIPKTCLVTGASAGIGQATALALIRAGHTVYGAARRADRLDAVRAAGGHALALDVTDEDAVQKAVEQIADAEDRIDVLVNNAGGVLHGSVEETPLDLARREFDVNVFAPARLAQLVLPYMRARRSGTIVNVSSIGGEIALPFGAWYYASKHALEALSDTLRQELRPFGVRVVLVQPGIIRTDFETTTAAQLREFSGRGPYARAAESMARRAEHEMGERRRGSDPAVVARVIRHAVESAAPKPRYAVGQLAGTLLTLNRLLPDRAFDALVTRPLSR